MRIFLIIAVILFTGRDLISGTDKSGIGFEVAVRYSENTGEIKFNLSAGKVLSVGSIGDSETKEVFLKIENSTDFTLTKLSLHSPCTCIQVPDNIPEKLPPKSSVKIMLKFSPAGYSGTVRKFLVLSAADTLNPDSVYTCIIPAVFTVKSKITRETAETEQSGKTDPPDDGMTFINTDNAGSEDLSQYNAVLFSAPNCPACNYVKQEILPVLFKEYPAKILIANPEKENNILFLIRLEEIVKSKSTDTPVLLYGGRLYHGTKEIKELAREVSQRPNAEPSKAVTPELERKLNKSEPGENNSDNPEQSNTKPLKTSSFISNLTIGTVITGGLIDGINPCVFAAMIFFISLLYTAGFSSRKMLLVGIVYITACFITYFCIGLGLFSMIMQFMKYAGFRKIVNTGLGIVLILFAVLSFADALRFGKSKNPDDVLLRLPDSMKNTVNRIMKKAIKYRLLLPGIFITGITVTLIETVCTGQVYIPVLAMLVKQNASGYISMKALLLLLIYNIMFCIPLIVLFVLIYSGVKTMAFIKISKKHLPVAKIVMGCFFVILALIMFKG